MANKVSDGRIAQHPSAVRQCRATETQNLAVGEPDVDRSRIARSHHLGAPRDECAQLFFRQFKASGIAAVIDQSDEWRPVVLLFVGKGKIMAERAVDEFGAG